MIGKNQLIILCDRLIKNNNEVYDTSKVFIVLVIIIQYETFLLYK